MSWLPITWTKLRRHSVSLCLIKDWLPQTVHLKKFSLKPTCCTKSVGLPPTWGLAAVVVGGGLFGAAGMLLCVPLTAVLYALLFGEQE